MNKKAEIPKILFLEDNPSLLEHAVKELNINGVIFDFEIVCNRVDFERKLASSLPDVLVSDLIPPTLSLTEALTISHAIIPSLPVIVLTESIDIQAAVTCMKSGVVDCITRDMISKFPAAVTEALEISTDRPARHPVTPAGMNVSLPELPHGLVRETYKIMTKIQEKDEIIDSLRNKLDKYHDFFQNDLSSNYESTANGDILYCNDAFITTFGFSNRAHALSSKTLCLYEDLSVRNKIIGLVRENRVVRRQEITYRTLDGRRLYGILNAVGVFDKEGNLSSIMKFTFDLTEIKEAQIQSINALKEAEKLSLLKNAFITNISHEIRTPLNAIIGMSSIIREALPDDIRKKTSEYYSEIDNASERLSRTINMILTISSLEAGLYEERTQNLNLDDFFTAILKQFHPEAQKKNLGLTYENHSGLSCISVDKYSLMEIASNLIDNSIKFTQTGAVDVCVHLKTGRILQFFFRDTGIGMTDEFQKSVFTPFSQEDAGLARTYEGLGLGLPIVDRLCRLCDYSVILDSKKGNGTLIIIEIPLLDTVRGGQP